MTGPGKGPLVRGRQAKARDAALAGRLGDVLAAAGVETVRLHVGLAKTGTTHLQALLRENAATLRQRGALFPESLLRYTSDAGGARGLRSAGHGALLQILRGSGQGAGALARLAAELAGARPRVLILSAEALTQPDNLCLAAPLRQALDGLQVSVLAYVRNPADWVESLYKELVTGGHFRETRPLAGALLAELQAAAALGPIVDAWGWPEARLELASYDAAPDLAADFGARVPEAAGLIAPSFANRSPSRAATERFRELNLRARRLSQEDFLGVFSAFSADVADLDDPGGQTLLAPEVRTALIERWMDGNAFVVARGLMPDAVFAGLARERPRATPWVPLPRDGLLSRVRARLGLLGR